MHQDWNEELRRAYDRGYWDARREFEHHLRLHDNSGHNGRRDEEPRRGYGSAGNRMTEYGEDHRHGRDAHDRDGGRFESLPVGRGGERRFNPMPFDARRHEHPGPIGSQGSRYGHRGDWDEEERRDYPPGDRNTSRDDRGERESGWNLWW